MTDNDGAPARSKTLESMASAAPAASVSTIQDRLENARILVVVEPLPADLWRQRERLIQAYVLLNLLPRVFPNVSCEGIDPSRLFGAGSDHASQIGKGCLDPTLVLALADRAIEGHAGAPTLYVDNRGWTAYLSRAEPCNAPRGPGNTVGAYFAAALAVSEVFNLTFRDLFPRAELCPGTYTFDLVTLEENKPPNHSPNLFQVIRVPECAIVGLGAIGQALIDIMAQLPSLSGSLHLIDPERTDAGNESRYVLSYPPNRGLFKVLIAHDRIKKAFPLMQVTANGPTLFHHMSTTVVGHAELATVIGHSEPVKMSWLVPPLDYEAYQNRFRNSMPYPLVISATDSEQNRRDIQFGLHKTVLNAWTDTADGRMNYAVGRHQISGPNCCLACLYHPPTRDHEPTPTEFFMELTGWSKQDVENRLQVGAGSAVSPSEVNAMAKRRGIAPEDLQALVGKSLDALLHDPQCGLANIPGPDREARAQVPHVPVLAACHLATQLILEALGDPRRLENLAIFDALTPPNKHAAQATRSKQPGCLCGDQSVIDAYGKAWSGAGN